MDHWKARLEHVIADALREREELVDVIKDHEACGEDLQAELAAKAFTKLGQAVRQLREIVKTLGE